MKHLFSACLLAPVFLILFACSNSEPSILSVTGTAVFDFADSDSNPTTRLAIFVQTDSEAQRAQRLSVSLRESGLSWLIDEPRMISGSDKNWSGYTNLQPAPGEELRTGVYDCRYVDAAGNEASAHISVQYPETLLTATAATARECIKTSVIEYIALYSETQELMFFNKRRNNWRTNIDIAKDYRNAYTLRRCLVTGNNGIVCLLPAEALKEVAVQNEETSEE